MKTSQRAFRPDPIEEEEWDRVRMGYLSAADERVWQDAFHTPLSSKRTSRPRQGRPDWQQKVMRHRTGYLAGEKLYRTGRREVVVKAVSRAKSPETIANMLGYIIKPRESGEDKTVPELCNEFGVECSNASVAELLKDWSLTVQPVPEVAGAQVESTSESIGTDSSGSRQLVLAHHMVVSVDRKGDDPGRLLERLDKAAHLAVDEVFTRNGYRVYWALHIDKPIHPHIHIVVKAQSDNGDRLWFDRTGDHLHYIRLVFAEHLTRQGIECQATRRVDRPETRFGMIRGDLPLKSGSGQKFNSNWSSRLRDRTPNWWARVQQQQQVEWREQKKRDLHEVSLKFPRLQTATRQLRNDIAKKWRRRSATTYEEPFLKDADIVFKEPQAAVISLLELGVDGRDNTAFTAWLIRNAPAQFGALRSYDPRQVAVLTRMSRNVWPLRGFFQSHKLPKQLPADNECPLRGPERDIARVDYQRRAIAREVLRVGAYCRDEMDDPERAYQIRWELSHAFLAAGPVRRGLTTPKPRRDLRIGHAFVNPNSFSPQGRDLRLVTGQEHGETPSPAASPSNNHQRRYRGHER